MAKFTGLEKLTYGELVDLKDRIEEAMEARKIEEARAVKAAIEAMAAEAGFTVDELMGGGGRRKRKVSAAPEVRYRNPKDPSQTWTGRGRRPSWLLEAMDKGVALEKFAV